MNAEPLPSPLRWGRLMTEGERAEAPGIVPLPKPDRQLGAAAANEVKFCTKLGIGGKLPSVAMFTAMHCSSSLNVLTFSRDGSTSAIGLADSTIHVFDAENRFSSRSLHGHSSSVFGLSFSPSARILASSSSDSNICLWGCDAATGSGPLAFLKGHVGAVWDISFAPRGNYIASCGRDRTARVWSTDRAAPLRILPGHVTDVDTVRWHPNCNYVATGGGDKSIRLWDVQSGETVRLMTGHNGSVTSLAFSPDGLTLASGSDTGAVLLWDLRSGKRVATTQQHKGPVWSLDFDAGEGGILASGAADCSVRLWNVPTMGSTDNSAGDGHGAKANGPNEHNHIDDVPDDAGLPPKPTTTTTGPLPFQPSLLKVLYTKSTPCIALQFTKRNLLLAGGACSLGMS